MRKKTVYVIYYSQIDVHYPIDDPEDIDELAGLLPCTLTNAGRAFLEAGWEGVGEIAAMWIPPFMFTEDNSMGLHLWHVKQQDNGTSWLCADRPYGFLGLEGRNWKAIEIVEPN